MAAFKYCLVILLAISVAVVLCEEIKEERNDQLLTKNWGENTVGRAEAKCRYELQESVSIKYYYLIASGICALSVVFLLLSIGVFFYVQRYVSFLLCYFYLIIVYLFLVNARNG